MPDTPQPRKTIPTKSSAPITRVLDQLPDAEREGLKEVFRGIPLDKNPFNMLLDLAVIQYKMAFGRNKQVAIVGPANVGKSTLFNQIIDNKKDKAEVGPVPGTTRINQVADAGLFAIVDTPGADAVGYVGEKERDLAFEAASQADFLILMFDAIQGVKQTELDLYQDLTKMKKPYLIVLNKIDLARRHKEDVINKAALNLGIEPEAIIPISALKGEGVSKILMTIASSDPELLIALGQALPHYRWKLAWRSIVTASSLSAAIALTPLPIIDFIPLVVTQTTMMITIARIYNYRITFKRAKELIATFGLGMLGRLFFQQLSKAGGIPGWLLSSAIATSMTLVMGYTSVLWFDKGEQLTQERIKQLGKKLTQEILLSLKNVFKKKPSKKNMQQTIIDILEETPRTVQEDLQEAAGLDPDQPLT